MIELWCTRCKEKAKALWEWRCAFCEGPLHVVNRPWFDPDQIDTQTLSPFRYRAIMGLGQVEPFSLGEGFSPLLSIEVAGDRFWVKLEYLSPTASYKDRGAVVLVSMLRALGVTEVIDDSSGNAGASLAAYAAAAKMTARLFIPQDASLAKRRQIEVFGAKLVLVPGERQAATEAAIAASTQSVYASHAWSPISLLGQMSFGWELWEQMPQLPDAILFPVGQGGLLLGAFFAFCALRDAGLIARLPRLYAVQPEAYSSVVRAWRKEGQGAPGEARLTAAEGLRVKTPVRLAELMRALEESEGGAFSVSEEEIVSAREALCQRGLFVEPTSAVPVAALQKVRALLGPEARLLVPLTGSGIKGG